MKRLMSAAILAISLLLAANLTAAAQVSYSGNAQHALQWLQCTQQQPNGQIGSGGNPIARSAEVALGLAAAGQTASAMHVGAVSLGAYLTTAASTDVGTNGELLLARASQADAGPAATVAAQLQASKSTTGATSGEYGGDIFSDALAILGLRADGQAVGADAVTFLKSQQKSDGGWSYDNADAYGTDSNTTALVIQALLSSGVPASNSSIAGGFTYLQIVFGQGGFGNTPGAGPDANSDELAIQAILAAGRQSDAAWSSMLDQALGNLAAQQVATGADAGAINGYSKLFATTEAPTAFLLRPLTVAGRAEVAVPLLACPASAAVSATPTATPHPTPAPTPAAARTLAQTGGGADGRRLLTGFAILVLGIGVLRRQLRRAPRR